FDEEVILLVRKLAEYRNSSIDDILNVRSDLRGAQRDIALAEHQVVTRAPGIEIENFELTDEGRRIDEDVIVTCDEVVALLFQARINLPPARHFVFDAVRNVLLTDNVHER